MEKIKQYLPYIIGIAIVLYIVSRMRSRETILAPQTQFSETLPTDPYAQQRLSIFEGLLSFAEKETEFDFAKERAQEEIAFAREKLTLEGLLTEKAIDAGIERARIESISATNLANLEILRRNQDIEGQRYAIDRFYSSRNNQSIFDSITQTIAGIFGNRGGIIRTPPTFPSLGGFI